ncbi:MAG: UDP-glucose 4-epimerase GalE [Alphaproteobacteria bacterium]
MNKIFITGGSGYIGGHICKILNENAYDIINYDLRRNCSIEKYASYIQGDICDTSFLTKTLQEVQPDIVIHLAALIKVEESFIIPGAYYKTNTLGTLSVLESMKEAQIKNILFSSTAAVYSLDESDNCITEKNTLNPINVYGRSKLFAEEMISDFAQQYDINYIIFRFFNAVGTDDHSEIGINTEDVSNLLPLVILTALGKRDVLKVFGKDYNTPDCTAIRDYIHVLDIADAHLKAIQLLHSDDKPKKEVFNLGTEQGYSVEEVISKVEKVTGITVNKEYVARRQGDAEKVIASSQKACQKLNWSISHDFLERAVKSTYEWYKK